MQRLLHRGAIRHLRAGLAVAVILVDRLVLRKNAHKLKTVFFYLFLHAGVEFSARCAVDDQLHGSGLELELADHLRNAPDRLHAPARAVRNKQHGIHVRKRASGDMLETRLVVDDHVFIVSGILVDLGLENAVDKAVAALALRSSHDEHVEIVFFDERGIELHLRVIGLCHVGRNRALLLGSCHFLADVSERGFDLHAEHLVEVGVCVRIHNEDGTLFLLAQIIDDHAAGLRTADSGYLTRRLVDVSQELIIHDTDCVKPGQPIPGMYVSAFMDGNEEIESLQERITGRFSAEDIKDKDGNVIVKANHMITPRRAERVMKKGVDENGNALEQVKIRTILTCKCKSGVCSRCYGANMATGEAVQVGEAVGIMAAQSIGEPGTQLTMRTFHNGGVAGDDITQGLPRVEELFEARKPKGLAIITEFAGRATISDTKKKREVIVTNEETGESKAYLIPYGSRIKIQDGAMLGAGDELTEGSVNPHDILKIKGLRAAQDYMLQEVQRVYRLQGVEINDKHIEVIVRQMLKKIRIEEKGDTEFLPGTMVDVLEFEEVNEQLVAEGKEPATGEQIMLGITKASLATESFLSAASFQETTKVLTEAAIKGKVDHLVGLKENVIIGKHIPAGTGMKKYRDVKLNTDLQMEDELDLDDEISLEDLDTDADLDLNEEIDLENTEETAGESDAAEEVSEKADTTEE